MSVKPVLFNTDMVRALLANRKTVTRRVVKLEYSNTHLEMFTNKYGTRLIEKQNEEPGITTIRNPDGTTTHTVLACIEKEPPCRPGDILYVRETFSESASGIVYKADEPDSDGWGWRPSIHMPREAARIFLRVTDVRAERLQEIDGCSVLTEGVDNGHSNPAMGKRWENMQLMAFSALWNSTLKPADRALYGWEANPWVWVIEFERISREEAEHGKTGIGQA